jgi:hypothetical protein
MIEAQVHYVLECLKTLSQHRADFMDVRSEAQQRFNAKVQADLKGTVWTSGCQSWYQQEDGKNAVLWPGGTWRYWLETRHVNEADYVFGKATNRGAASRSGGPSHVVGGTLLGDQAIARVTQR